MKTQWTEPGRGVTLRELLAQASAALPHLCGPAQLGDYSNGRTDLAITMTGVWEEHDVERIRNCRCGYSETLAPAGAGGDRSQISHAISSIQRTGL